MTVEMAYHSSGQLSQLIAKNPVTGDQVTSYVYGTGKAAIAPLVHRNDLLTAEIYPESDDFENSQNILHNGGDGVVDRVEFQYNRAGERVWKRDQNGTIHHYEYDNLGRLLHDRVTTLASGIDASVRKIATAYDLIGNVKSVTSSDLSGGVLDQIVYEYDECGLLCREFHATDGLVDFVVTPCVAYTYDKAKDGDLFLKNFRTIFVIYPSGRVIGYEYGTANSEADRLNRCTAIKDGAVTLATYTHLGVSSPMKVTYNQPGLVLDYTASGALDRFGRVTEHTWKKGATNVARIKHGYDRLGSRLYREDGVGVNRDELYSYDDTNQLLGMERGKLNAVKNAVTNKSFAENFVFDATGNWLVYERDDNGDQIWDLSQTRTHNKANEITCLDSSHTNIAHDRNGNMTKMPKPDSWSAAYDCVYDAWNRLVQVKDGNTVTATYKYNGLNQRIRKTVGTVVTQSVFNHNWQELESKTGSVTTTYVWGLRYIDDLICRDRGGERLYAIQDPNWNAVALCNASGTVQERISCNAFGKPTWLDVNHGPKTTSGYDWNRTFTGQVYDPETGLMLYRNRFYHLGLGRFVTRDPIGYGGGDVNLYRYVGNATTIMTDPFGFIQVCCRRMQTRKFLDRIINHCQLRNKCVPGEKGSDVQVDSSSSRQLASCPGKKCSEATTEDIEKCLRDYPHSDTPYPGIASPGNNCQEGAARRMGKCCLISDWKPDLFVGTNLGRGKCLKRVIVVMANGSTVNTCLEWEYTWQVETMPDKPDPRTPILPRVDDRSHAGWTTGFVPPGVVYPEHDEGECMNGTGLL